MQVSMRGQRAGQVNLRVDLRARSDCRVRDTARLGCMMRTSRSRRIERWEAMESSGSGGRSGCVVHRLHPRMLDLSTSVTHLPACLLGGVSFMCAGSGTSVRS